MDNAASLSAHEMMERVTQQMGMLAFGASLPNYMGPDSLQHHAGMDTHTQGSGQMGQHAMQQQQQQQQQIGPTGHNALGPGRGLPMGGGMGRGMMLNNPMAGGASMGGHMLQPQQGGHDQKFSMSGLGMVDGGVGGGAGMHAATQVQARARRPRGGGSHIGSKDLSHLSHSDGGDVDFVGADAGYKVSGRGAAGGGRGRSRKR